jgi:DtxR family transcriptional regulator, Mn-dependent transcriptional regulator
MSISTDNYLKAIYALSNGTEAFVNTNAIASKLNTRASSATDMIKKLERSGWVTYQKYHGVALTEEGKKIALDIVRRHRIWEVFLSEKLGFEWNEVHDIAEQLEHVTSSELISRLESFLNYPKFDPHGDPIPDASGRMPKRTGIQTLENFREGDKVRIISVDDSSSAMLIHLSKNRIIPGAEIMIKKHFDFDNSIQIKSKSGILLITEKMASGIQAQKLKT